MWRDAVRQVGKRANSGITQGTTPLDRAAMALWDKALSGNVPAIKELGNRLDGKVTQAVELDADVEVNGIVRTIVYPAK